MTALGAFASVLTAATKTPLLAEIKRWLCDSLFFTWRVAPDLIPPLGAIHRGRWRLLRVDRTDAYRESRCDLGLQEADIKKLCSAGYSLASLLEYLADPQSDAAIRRNY